MAEESLALAGDVDGRHRHGTLPRPIGRLPIRVGGRARQKVLVDMYDLERKFGALDRGAVGGPAPDAGRTAVDLSLQLALHENKLASSKHSIVTTAC